MKTSLKIILLCIGTALSLCFTLPDDDDPYATDDYMRYDDYTYVDSIMSVQLFNSKSQLSYPIIGLQSGEVLEMHFDDLRKENKIYHYTVIHCNADWKPSELQKPDYIEGFFEDEIFKFQYAENTDVFYTHYSFNIPNENMKFIQSGNYLLKIYEVGYENKPVITKRFMVVQNSVNIRMNIKRATDINESYYRQEIDFKINHEGYDIKDPFQNLKVVLMQNYRWDNAIYGLKPMFVKDTELNYDYNDGSNVFDGNNEFLNFDVKSTQYQTIEVKTIKYDPSDRMDHVYLLDDHPRSFKQYSNADDLNGNFLVKKDGTDNVHVQADYVKVHFSLAYGPPLNEGNLYLFGKFTDWKFKEEMKLRYDTTKLRYEQEVMLKQGYYDYAYCYVKDGAKNKGDMSTVSGSHHETDNEYMILVYHRGVNDNFDRLIGLAKRGNRAK